MDIIEISIRLFIALVLGMLIGLERIITKHEAGVRTYGLMSMGAALFIVLGIEGSRSLNVINTETIRIIGQIVTGVGFLGAGFIFMSEKEHRRVGLTSAATLWVVVGIGMACGFGFYNIGIIVTLLTLLTLTAVWHLEYGIVKTIKGDNSEIITIENLPNKK
jgi:putative Mg2+ transporter-C (MgtC) family protein